MQGGVLDWLYLNCCVSCLGFLYLIGFISLRQLRHLAKQTDYHWALAQIRLVLGTFQSDRITVDVGVDRRIDAIFLQLATA